jgi:hypothetical protein
MLLAVAAILNGVLRESTYGKSVSELAAHQISTVTAIILTGIVVWLFHRAWPLESARQAWTVGLLWFVMTIVFEFGFGHFVAGHSFSRLVADYNLLQGRVWALFLVWITVMPYMLFKLSRTA